MHFEDDSGCGLWVFGEDEWDLFQHKCEGKQGGGISSGFNGEFEWKWRYMKRWKMRKWYL